MRETEAGAREQLRALSDVLSVVSGAPNDVQPVLQAVIENAVRLCDATNGSIVLIEEPHLRVAVSAGTFADPAAYHGYWRDRPVPNDRSSLAGRVLLDRASVQIKDSHADPQYQRTPAGTAEGVRTMLGVPLVRQDRILGVVILRRREVAPFSPDQIQLVEAFSAQAAIAIENVRLFNETKESLEQQRAMSEVLAAIGRATDDVTPVFQTILEHAGRLCDADRATIVMREGDLLPVKGGWNIPREAMEEFTREPVAIDRTSAVGRSVTEGRTLLWDDITADQELSGRMQRTRGLTGARSVMTVPLLREGVAIGAINLRRTEVRPFTTRQAALVERFAEHAVLAIENVRLFNETKEALEQQTAVSDVLASIGRSAFDLPTLLGTVIERAARLCHAPHGIIYRLEAGVLRIVAAFQIPNELRELNERLPLMPGDRGSVVGRATAERRPVRIDDAVADPEYRLREHQRIGNLRSMLGVPLLSGDEVIGAMSLWRPEPVPFTDAEVAIVTTFADQAAIAMENVRLFNETKEALEQQTAISDVLASISGSVFDLGTVLRTIAERALALCHADQCNLYRVLDEERIELLVRVGTAGVPGQIEEGETLDRKSPALASRSTRTLETHHVADAREHPELPEHSVRARLAVPIVRDGTAVGTMLLGRFAPGAFSPREIELVQTFAQQAGIAIENVRLFNETKEALERQTAVSEILRVMAGSPTDVTPVLQAIAESAARFCGAENVSVILEGEDGLLHPLGNVGTLDTRVRPFPVDRSTVTGRSMLEGRPVHVHDLQAESEEFPLGSAQARMMGHRTTLATPLVRAGRAFGAILLRRGEVRPFTEKQVDLVRTFADQAVIAIDNVRLFNETKEALEQQTATSEVLQAISRSAFDLQAVLDTVVERAAKLCGAEQAWMRRIEGDQFRFAAYYGSSPELRAMFDELRQEGALAKIDHAGLGGRAILERRPIHVHDVVADRGLRETSLARRGGGRTALAVPMLRDGEPIGAIVVARSRVAPFNDREIRLVETFADQAVIAIENVRLFYEIQEQSRQLEIAGKHKSEFLANMSHELRTPLNAIIGFSEVLLQGMFGELNEKQREYQQDVLSSGRHLLSLINDILDLAKIEAGRVELELGEFSLPAALENGVTMIRERAARHGIRVELDVGDVDRVVADERKVKQIVFNLLSNAVKFTRDGGHVGVRASRRDGEIRVAVRDTGIGIDEADRERIFEEFQQASRDPERSREGTGLGLALTRRYVELHGGRIWVESEVGRGSTFTFALPAVPPGKEG